MPALSLFGRTWLVAADDLPLPMMCLMVVHTVWYAPPAAYLQISLPFFSPSNVPTHLWP
jgi:hypothetical protein